MKYKLMPAQFHTIAVRCAIFSFIHTFSFFGDDLPEAQVNTYTFLLAFCFCYALLSARSRYLCTTCVRNWKIINMPLCAWRLSQNISMWDFPKCEQMRTDRNANVYSYLYTYMCINMHTNSVSESYVFVLYGEQYLCIGSCANTTQRFIEV